MSTLLKARTTQQNLLTHKTHRKLIQRKPKRQWKWRSFLKKSWWKSCCACPWSPSCVSSLCASIGCPSSQTPILQNSTLNVLPLATLIGSSTRWLFGHGLGISTHPFSMTLLCQGSSSRFRHHLFMWDYDARIL